MYTNYTSIKYINGSPLLLGIRTFFTQLTKLSSLMCVVHQSAILHYLNPFCWLLLLLVSFTCSTIIYGASLVAQMVKNPPAMQKAWVRSLGWEDPLEEGHGNPFQYSCLEKPHGQRSLAGYSPLGCKELDTTERLSAAQGQGPYFHRTHCFSHTQQLCCDSDEEDGEY